MTVGRRPVTEGWGLEELSLTMAGRFIAVDDACRTSMRGVHAIGDVTGEPMLAHRAMAQGEMVAEIVAGHRRVAAAVEAGLPEISVLVQPEADGLLDPMRSVSENLIRAEMGPVDRWRSMQALTGAGWTEDAIASALGLTPRAVAQLRLLADICPAMLDQMARGDMPNERELRIIAAAGAEEQGRIWKNRPKWGERVHWSVIAQALAKERFYARDAQFGADEATARALTAGRNASDFVGSNAG